MSFLVNSSALLAAWVHDWDPIAIPFPEGFPLDGVRWYGLAYLAGFAVAWWLLSLYYNKGRSPLDADAQASLMTYCIIGVLAGGRLGYKLFYDWDGFTSDPVSLLRVWEGGMASHGGFIGVLIALILFARSQKLNLFRLGDLVVTLVPPGLLFGRLANFINGELWGKPTGADWGVVFPLAGEQARHPSQLYEAALEGAVMLAWTQYRFWRKPDLPAGQLAGEFLLGYAVVRIIGEQFREPDARLLAGISRGAFYSIFLAIAGVALIVHAKRNNKASR